MKTRSEHMQDFDHQEEARANRAYIGELRSIRHDLIFFNKPVTAPTKLAHDAVVRAIDELIRKAESDAE